MVRYFQHVNAPGASRPAFLFAAGTYGLTFYVFVRPAGLLNLGHHARIRRSDDQLRGNQVQVTAILTPAPEGGYTALNPETGTTSQGETIEQALANLREAVELYLEVFPLKLGGSPLVTTFTIAEHA